MTELKPNVIVSFESAQRLYDMIANSLDWGSGFLETDDVNVLRELAVKLGIDPMKATPSEFKKHYKHTFVSRSKDEARVARMIEHIRASEDGLKALTEALGPSLASDYKYKLVHEGPYAGMDVVNARLGVERLANDVNSSKVWLLTCDECDGHKDMWPHREEEDGKAQDRTEHS